MGWDQALPTGTVTLLLADVEGSTKLWQDRPAEMTAAMSEMNSVVDDAVATCSGVRPMEQGEGDSFVIAFPRASDAITCALALQQGMTEGLLRLRMGLHTGEIEVHGDRYDGQTIIRAARLRDLAHGGQVVVSSATRDLTQDALPADASFLDLGSHRLKGLDRAERVSQLVHPSLSDRFPPLRSEARTGTLPVQLTTFVGRADELAHAKRSIRKNRMVTLTGAGGCGKTRLAIEAIGQLADAFDDVRFCDLAAIADPELVPDVAREAFGIPESSTTDALDQLCQTLGNRDEVIVIDNCEHVIDATARLADAILRRCPNTHIVATSREPLGVEGEVVWRVPSLERDDAVALFVERAERVQPNFVVTDKNAGAVDEICTRLDGIPLALELAAARLRVLAVEQIVDGLNDRFRMLGRGSRTVLARQQTLLASVGWSYDLLTDDERAALRQLSAFTGGFTFEAAQDVVTAEGVDREAMLDLLSRLVDRSLVVADDTTTRTTYRLLETIRQFARDKLVDSGEAESTAERHLDHYRAMLRALGIAMVTGSANQLSVAEAVDDVYDNVRSAVEWAIAAGHPEKGLRLVSRLASVNATRSTPGQSREMVRWLTELLASDEIEAVTRARGQLSLARACGFDDLVGWTEATSEAIAILRSVGDRRFEANALATHGVGLAFIEQSAGVDAIKRAGLIATAIGDLGTLLVAKMSLAQALGYVGREALEASLEGLELAKRSGVGVDHANMQLAVVLAVRGDLAGAGEAFTTAVESFRATNNPVWVAKAEGAFAGFLLYRGEIERVLGMFSSSLALMESLDADPSFFFTTLSYASYLANIGRFDESEAVLHQMLPQVGRITGLFGRSFTACLEALLAMTALGRGDHQRARELAEPAAQAFTTDGWGFFGVSTLVACAYVSRTIGEIADAERHVARALDLVSTDEMHLYGPEALELAAALRSDVGGVTEAARLIGAASAQRERMGAVRTPNVFLDIDDLVSHLRLELGEAFDVNVDEGRGMSAADAYAYALRGRGPRQRPQAGWDALTPTELKVVELVAEGLSNPQVAERLFVSRRTVSTHLSHVFAKLGVSSRAELASLATKRGVGA